MSAVVYARVPDALKQALQAYAAARGRTLTNAVVELLESGLEASAGEHSRTEREGELARATSELTQTRAQLQEAEFRLQAAREREQLSAHTYSAFAARARHELASCPRCRKPLLGSDLLVSGRCPNCDKALTSLLVPTRFAELVQNEYLALFGALGVLAGLAITTSTEQAG
jgi:hypothetical protein